MVLVMVVVMVLVGSVIVIAVLIMRVVMPPVPNFVRFLSYPSRKVLFVLFLVLPQRLRVPIIAMK